MTSGELAGLLHASLTYAEAALERMRDPNARARFEAVVSTVDLANFNIYPHVSPLP